jgi:hypothetical protein
MQEQADLPVRISLDRLVFSRFRRLHRKLGFSGLRR